MAEEGGGGHSDGGSSSAPGCVQRQPPPAPSQTPQPGSQVSPVPALAPDQLPQNNTLVALPIVAIENILSFMSYDEISQLRLVRPPWVPSAISPGLGERSAFPRESTPASPSRCRIPGCAPLPPKSVPQRRSAGVGWAPRGAASRGHLALGWLLATRPEVSRVGLPGVPS